MQLHSPLSSFIEGQSLRGRAGFGFGIERTKLIDWEGFGGRPAVSPGFRYWITVRGEGRAGSGLGVK